MYFCKSVTNQSQSNQALNFKNVNSCNDNNNNNVKTTANQTKQRSTQMNVNENVNINAGGEDIKEQNEKIVSRHKQSSTSQINVSANTTTNGANITSSKQNSHSHSIESRQFATVGPSNATPTAATIKNKRKDSNEKEDSYANTGSNNSYSGSDLRKRSCNKRMNSYEEQFLTNNLSNGSGPAVVASTCKIFTTTDTTQHGQMTDILPQFFAHSVQSSQLLSTPEKVLNTNMDGCHKSNINYNGNCNMTFSMNGDTYGYSLTQQSNGMVGKNTINHSADYHSGPHNTIAITKSRCNNVVETKQEEKFGLTENDLRCNFKN